MTEGLDKMLVRSAEFKKAVEDEKKANGYPTFFFFVVDIKRGNSYALKVGDDENEILKKAFSDSIEAKESHSDNWFYIRGKMSRKRHFYPALYDRL